MELLAPAGNWDAFLAAIKNGADAVYLGGKKFSARQSADNFDEDQLREALEFAHFWGRRIYVTANTLIDNHEMKDALDYLYRLYQMEVDAVIVQDIGLIQACRQVLPELRLHGSTQMTIHNAEAASFWRGQGLKRIVLSRECSQEDIKSIKSRENDYEFEVFVHGALCYSYSGQCLFSSLVGGRSGNRGRCAQPCRLPYDILALSTGEKCTSEHGKYVLSPADLCLLEHLKKLEQAGVHSLKIEGRMKRPEYVAIVTGAYREALDDLKAGRRIEEKEQIERKNRLLKIFNRNFTTGYLFVEQPGFLSSTRPNNRGTYAGRVVEQKPSLETDIKLASEVNLGDGLTVWGKGKNPSTVIKSMQVRNQPVTRAEAGDTITIMLDNRVSPQDRVFKTHDENLIQEAQATIKEEQRFKIAVDVRAVLRLDQPVAFIFTDEKGGEVTVETRSKAQKAVKHPLNEEIIRDKLERMGNTFFYLRSLMLDGETDLMVPVSDLNEARRQAIARLKGIRLQNEDFKPISEEDYSVRNKIFFAAYGKGRKKANQVKTPLLTVSVASTESAEAALLNGADFVYLGLEGLGSHQRIKPQVLKDICDKYEGKIIPQLPRIHKPSDKTDYRARLEGICNAVMPGNWGDFHWFAGKGLTISTDYNLNVFNSYAVKFLQNHGVESICISPELNFNQLQTFPDFDKVEMLIHGEIILMESQFCMLGEVLGQGGGEKHCGMPCLQDSYLLRDEKRYNFPVITDADCRLYVFNSRTLCMMEDLPRILSLNPARLRIEGRRMQPGEIGKTVKSYRQALTLLQHGKKPDLESLKKELENEASSAFTKCHYYRGVL